MDAAAIDKRKSQTVCMSMVQKHIRLFNKKITAKQKDKNRVSSDPPPKKAASDILRAATMDDLGAIDYEEQDEEQTDPSQELSGHKKRAGLARAFTAPTEALSDFGEEDASGSEKNQKGQQIRGNKAAFDTRKSKRAKLDLLTVVEEEEEDISPCAGDELQHPLSTGTATDESRAAKAGSGESDAGGATGLQVQNGGESVDDGDDLGEKKGEHDHRSPEKQAIPPTMVRVSKAVEPDYVDVSSASPAQEEAKQTKSSSTPKNPRLSASGVKATMSTIPEGRLSTGAASKELPEVESASHSAKKLAGTSTGFHPAARKISNTSSAIPRKSVKTPEPPMPASRLSARVDLSTLKEDESIEAGGDATVHLAAELGASGAAAACAESIQSEKENAVPAQPGGRHSARISVKESSAALGSAGRNSARLSSTGRRSVKSTGETPLQEQVKRVSARNSANSLLGNSVSKLDFEKVNSDEKKDGHDYGVDVKQNKDKGKTSVTTNTTMENAKSPPAGSETGLNDQCNTSKASVSAKQGQQAQNVKNSVNLEKNRDTSVSSTAAVVSAPNKPQPSPFANLVRDLCNSTLFRTMDRNKDGKSSQ